MDQLLAENLPPKRSNFMLKMKFIDNRYFCSDTQTQPSLDFLNKTKNTVQKDVVVKPAMREMPSRVVVNQKPERNKAATSLGTSFASTITTAYPESEIVEQFRSKLVFTYLENLLYKIHRFSPRLRDESLWLNKFSLDTNLTARRRPLAESSRISTVRDYGTWRSTVPVHRKSWKENIAKKYILFIVIDHKL